MLVGLATDFEKETLALKAVFDTHHPTPIAAFVAAPDRYAGVDYGVIRLLDAWARFCRALVLDSASGQAITAAGLAIGASPVMQQFATPEAALFGVRQGWGGRGYLWEPKWIDPSDTVKAAKAMGVLNEPTISAAVGSSQTTLPSLLRASRNYLVHRGPIASKALASARRAHKVARTVLDDDVPCAVLPGGITVFEACRTDLVIRAQAAVQ